LLWKRTVVAELKTVCADHAHDVNIGEKTRLLLNQWIKNGVTKVQPSSKPGEPVRNFVCEA